MENLSATDNSRTLNYKEWALIIFVSGLPLIGIIMLLVWAFSDDTNIHKKNWAKGSLLIMLVVMVIMSLFLFLFGGIALLANLNN